MDIKLISSLVALGIVILAGGIYIKDIFKGTTKPHLYTWIIWSITTGIAAAAVWYGGGGYAVIPSTIGAGISVFIVLLSFKYGTKDITLSDTISLIASLVAILLWVGFHNPLGSVLLGISIDIVGYWPTIRKTYIAPWSESVSSWVLWLLAPFFSVLSLNAYNIFTLVNYLPIIFVNALFLALCLLRRRVVPQP